MSGVTWTSTVDTTGASLIEVRRSGSGYSAYTISRWFSFTFAGQRYSCFREWEPPLPVDAVARSATSQHDTTPRAKVCELCGHVAERPDDFLHVCN